MPARAKFVLMLFSDASPEQVPTPIKGWSRYVIDTEDGYEDLYRRLTGQPRLRPAPSERSARCPPEGESGPKAQWRLTSADESRAPWLRGAGGDGPL